MIRKLISKVFCLLDSHYWVLWESKYMLGEPGYYEPYWYCKYCNKHTNTLSVTTKVRSLEKYYVIRFTSKGQPRALAFSSFPLALQYAQLWNWEWGYSIEVVKNRKRLMVYSLEPLKGQRVIFDRRHDDVE